MMSSVTINEALPGVVGKEFLKLLRSPDLKSLVVRLPREGDPAVEVNIEPYVDGVRQDEHRFTFPANVAGTIYSSDGHATTFPPEGKKVVGVGILWSYDVREQLALLLRVGDKVSWGFRGNNSTLLLKRNNLTANELHVKVERRNRNGWRLVTAFVADYRIEPLDGLARMVEYADA